MHCQKFTKEAELKTVDYYLMHGKCVKRTCKKLGYPSRPTLTKWIEEMALEHKKPCRHAKMVPLLHIGGKPYDLCNIY